VLIFDYIRNETIVSDDFKSKRKRQKAIRRADVNYRQREREQQRKRREIQRTKKQKICIEKDVRAIEARIPLRVLELNNEFNLLKDYMRIGHNRLIKLLQIMR